jgi:hypothetical protein
MAALHLFCPICGQKMSVGQDALRVKTQCPRCAKEFIPLDAIPRDNTLPARPVGEVGSGPGSLAGQARTVVMQNPAPGSPAAAATPAPADETQAAKPLPAPLPPPKPSLLVGQERTVMMAPPASALPSGPVPPPVFAGAAADPFSVAAPPMTSLDATQDASRVDATQPGPPPAEVLAQRRGGVEVTQDATKPAAPVVPVQAAIARPPVPVARSGGPGAELAHHASALLRGGASTRGLGYGHVAIVSAVAAVLALLLLALSESTVLRVAGGLLGTLALALALAALAAFLLVQSRKDASNDAPGPMSPLAWAVAAGGAVAIVLFAVGTSWGLAAMTEPEKKEEKVTKAPPPKETAAPSKPEIPPEKRADYKMKREGNALLLGGVMHVPAAFRSDEGEYDVYMHFHGNTTLVHESAEAAKVNAVVYVVNLGDGSGPYEKKYGTVGLFDQVLGKIQDNMKNRGLHNAKLRRIAVGSWSAGYGALSKILDAKKNADRIDAVIVLDGIHAAYIDPKKKTVDKARLGPFLRFAKEASEGKKLFTITHSNITGASYASTTETADTLLTEVGGERKDATDTPPRPEVKAVATALPKPHDTWLEQTSEGRAGKLHVRGYRGSTPDQHMAHLAQMSVTVMPELAEHWQ